MKYGTESLVVFTDYAGLATDLHVVVCGDRKIGWMPKIRGSYVEDGESYEVTVAYYELEKEHRSEANKVGTAMLRLAKEKYKPV